jgi:hypothetical protein
MKAENRAKYYFIIAIRDKYLREQVFIRTRFEVF